MEKGKGRMKLALSRESKRQRGTEAARNQMLGRGSIAQFSCSPSLALQAAGL